MVFSQNLSESSHLAVAVVAVVAGLPPHIKAVVVVSTS